MTTPTIDEPVAWRWKWRTSSNGNWFYGHTKPADGQFVVEPLYTRPAPPADVAADDAARWQFVVQHDEFHTDEFGNVFVSSHAAGDYEKRKYDESVDALRAKLGIK